jgi:serine O-acetyltransferase
MMDSDVSASIPNWDRERSNAYWNPGVRLIRTIRAYQYWAPRFGMAASIMRRVCVLRHRFWSVISGAEIPLNCQIGGGLILMHPNGVVIHPKAHIGPNCIVFQQVTIGFGGRKPGFPRLGGHVDVGAGAKILGGVHIGDHARIGANAVVISDVPSGATAVGVPARIIKKAISTEQDGAEYRINSSEN